MRYPDKKISEMTISDTNVTHNALKYYSFVIGETIALLKVPLRLRLRCTTFNERVAFFFRFWKRVDAL
jgi:hypothetical protein